MTLTEIERTTKHFSDARRSLAEKVQALEDEMTALKRRHLPGIRKAVETAAERQTVLKAAIEESPELFVKPKTFTMHGIRFGFKKEKGKLIWEDESKVIRLIKKSYPEDWEVYIKITEKPLKTSLEQLPALELKKLGIQVTEDADEIFIKSSDNEIDRIISALLNAPDKVEEQNVA